MLLVVGIGLRRWLKAGGNTEAIFRHAPARDGMLHLHDVFLALGGWLLGAALALQLLGVSLPDDPTPAQALHAAAVASVGSVMVIILLLLRASMATNQGLVGFGLGINRLVVGARTMVRVMVFIICATFLSLIAMTLLMKLLGVKTPAIAHDTLNAINDGGFGVKVGLTLVAVLVAPFTEEIVFRGFLQTAIRRSGVIQSRWGIILSVAALFALVHGNVAYQALPGLFVLGIGLGYVYERTGSLWTSIIIHAIFNALNVAMVLSGVVAE